jgi:hypothetical protein
MFLEEESPDDVLGNLYRDLLQLQKRRRIKFKWWISTLCVGAIMAGLMLGSIVHTGS